MSIINVAIVGVTGFTGVEALRILLSHPFVSIKNIVGNSHAGSDISELYPALSMFNLPKVQKLEEVNLQTIDCIFCCLPHQTSQSVVLQILNTNSKIKIIDLSADFRLPVEIYEEIYSKHLAPNLQKLACYGIPELFRQQISQSQIIACGGCFPTSALLPLFPLKDIIDGDIIIDSKTGITGAGKKDDYAYSFSNISDAIKAYNPHQHRHRAEISYYLNKSVRFTPHLVPVLRGIETSIYFKSHLNIKAILEDYYKNEQFVTICQHAPSTREVTATNFCKIFISQSNDEVFISSVIDNISKGSSSQAIQNMNIVFNFPEQIGINHTPIIP